MGGVINQITQNKGGTLEPWQAAQGGQVRLHHIVAIAGRPTGRGVVLHRCHFQIGRHQVLATVALFPGGVDKVLGLEALAHETPLHVRNRRHDRINGAVLDTRFQFLKRQLSCHLTAPQYQLG